MEISLHLPICTACGVQYESSTAPETCLICDDPRQYVPATGQAWTTLGAMQVSTAGYRNEIKLVDPEEELELYSVCTVPKFGMDQRALLMVRDGGKRNVLWDCVSFLDAETVERITRLGGISMIVLSHPHFYATHVDWARTFKCEVYLSSMDTDFLMRPNANDVQRFINEDIFTVEGDDELSVVRVDGHFPGSMVCGWKGRHLLVSDSISVALSGVGRRPRRAGTTSFNFMWSHCNMIPLDASAIYYIWVAIRDMKFDAVHGHRDGLTVKPNAKERVLESMKIVLEKMGCCDELVFDFEAEEEYLYFEV
ncbi:putative metallo-beta-lactamase domain protein [Myxozyma melibiosi]|uniref:Metallo-beta-lactamase domain protein n=1 Tax=Myxozyma melibiosi TaxID=54550 RepID=A0ABR1F555_9ASCO